MLRKRQLLFFGGCLFFGSIFLMLSQLDSSSHSDKEKSLIVSNHLAEVQNRFEHIEDGLARNKKLIIEIKDSISDVLKMGNIHDPELRKKLGELEKLENLPGYDADLSKMHPVNKQVFQPRLHNTNLQGTCQNLSYSIAKSDVNMINVYETLPFDDPDGGVWKQGYPIETSDAEWVGKKLKVFVVPHSHNDPGWIKTLDTYFRDQTQNILNAVVDVLSEDSKRRFIWAEMSYLSMWWDIATPERKEMARKLVKNGQLEIVTGGWVMNDEANTHYFEMIDQMIEGNDWLYRTFGVIPRSGWAIDPFGHSPTMAYILKKSQFENMLIQRVHYAIKKHLSLQKSLEFRWRQSWDTDTNTDMLCHLMPFYSYDVPHTCGPDPKICCQFDFARLPGFSYNCPWKVPPVAISDANVEARSKMLLDQYRKKSKLFKSDTLLIILGDDFRYSKKKEADAQFQNYERLFSYINSHPELNAELRFGTLSEYFDEMKKEMGGSKNLPALTGDFFTYADREDHYWSGYYTSRPFHKMQDRVLAGHLRGAEILFSLALPAAKKAGKDKDFAAKLYPLLELARRNLGLFQHHDGITGTAKDVVVKDYGNRLMRSVMDCKKVIAKSTEVLIHPDGKYDADDMFFNLDEVMTEQSSPAKRNVINVPGEGSGKSSKLVLYNSLVYDRTEMVRFLVSISNLEVLDASGKPLPSQINPVWSEGVDTRSDQFELVFMACLPAVGLASFTIRSGTSTHTTPATVKLFNDASGKQEHKGPIEISQAQPSDQITLENRKIISHISAKSGFLQFVEDRASGAKTKVAIDFATYSSRMSKDKSGAYLFLPSGSAQLHVGTDHRPVIRHVTGPLMSEVQVLLPNLVHRVTVYQGDGSDVQNLGVHVTNMVDIRSNYDNKELAMRLTSDVESGDAFHTDLNGFQMQARTTYAKLPMQANFYPLPSMAYIQDSKTRLSLFTGQPLGVASLKSGQLEVIMDRRLMQDDNRGLGQGVKDNVPTPEAFVLLVEHWTGDVTKNKKKLSYPSIASHMLSWQLLHPIRSMSAEMSDVDGASLRHEYRPIGATPCDIFLLNLRSLHDHDHVLPTDETALLLHRVGYECDLDSVSKFQPTCSISESIKSVSMTSYFAPQNACETSLILQHKCEALDVKNEVKLEPMQIHAFKLKLP